VVKNERETVKITRFVLRRPRTDDRSVGGTLAVPYAVETHNNGNLLFS
jgi:hypothetical protein